MRALVVVLVFSLTFAPVAWAAAPCTKQIYTDVKAEPDYDCSGPGEDALVPRLELKTSVALELGKKAPFEGILMGKNRVMALGLRIKALRRLRYLGMTSATEQREAERKFEASQFQATLGLRTSQRDTYKEQVKALQEEVISSRKWYRAPSLWFAVGVVVTAAGATALAFGLRK